MSYLHKSFHTHNLDGSKTFSKYNTVFFTGQYSLSNKIQVLLQVPFGFNNLEMAGNTEQQSGLGDVSVLANYKIWDETGSSVSQAVLIGGGIKLPTGSYVKPKTDNVHDRNFEIGTGSTDFTVNAIYRISAGNWIGSISGSSKFNSTNKEGYRYGNTHTIGSIIAYQQTWSNISFAPYLQLINENQRKDIQRGQKVEDSGGNVLFTGAGMDLSTSKFTVGVNYQFAAQSLAQGELNANPRLSVRVFFNL